jgi:hypothetical protein
MKTISKSYKVKWQLAFNNNYVWTECGKLFNFKTKRELKKTLKGSKIGYWIGSKFYKIEKLKKEIELIPKIICPF